MADSQKPIRITPVDTSKLLQSMAQASKTIQGMAQASKITSALAGSQASKITSALAGSQKLMRIASGAEFQKAAALANSRKLAFTPVDTSKLLQGITPVDTSKLLQGITPVDTSKLLQSVFSVLESAMMVPGAEADSGVASAAVAAPCRTPLLPGVANPWEQIRQWDLQGWIVFVTLIVTVVGVLLAAAQLRPQPGIAPEDLERIIRIIRENDRTTSTTTPYMPSPPCNSKSTRPLDGEKHHARSG
jgi:hypothetical protein